MKRRLTARDWLDIVSAMAMMWAVALPIYLIIIYLMLASVLMVPWPSVRFLALILVILAVMLIFFRLAQGGFFFKAARKQLEKMEGRK